MEGSKENPVKLDEVVIMPQLITVEQIRHICPFAPKNVDVFVPYLNQYMKKYGITSKEAIAAFIAQLAQESGQFKHVREIASGKAYEGRVDLGNTEKGDGVRFKGRGLIQTTGRANYKTTSLNLFGDVRLLNTPELLEVPEYAVMSACYYWFSKGLTSIAESNKTYLWRNQRTTAFEWITIKINGGLTHISERKQFWERAKQIIK